MALLLLQQSPPDLGGGSPLYDFVKVMSVLAGIVVLAWVGLKMWLPKLGGMRAVRSGLIEVIARQPLEARKTLYVVRAGSQHLLLASSGDSITLLREIPPDGVPEPPAQPPAGFSDRLRKLRGEGQ